MSLSIKTTNCPSDQMMSVLMSSDNFATALDSRTIERPRPQFHLDTDARDKNDPGELYKFGVYPESEAASAHQIDVPEERDFARKPTGINRHHPSPAACLILAFSLTSGRYAAVHFKRVGRSVTKQTYRIPLRTTSLDTAAIVGRKATDSYFMMSLRAQPPPSRRYLTRSATNQGRDWIQTGRTKSSRS